MENIDFITDSSLRKNIEDSVGYVYALFEESKKEGSPFYKEETNRVIILYIISIIEAILLYLYKKRGVEMFQIEYKFISELPKEYKHTNEKESKVVIAVQKNINKSDHQIGVFNLVKFLKEEKVLKTETAKDVLEINDIRNTFHLRKSRDRIDCNIARVESSFELLLRVIQGASRYCNN